MSLGRSRRNTLTKNQTEILELKNSINEMKMHWKQSSRYTREFMSSKTEISKLFRQMSREN